jgi:glucosamine--fructose-6-phosphate aminotransferase (isomerizing)
MYLFFLFLLFNQSLPCSIFGYIGNNICNKLIVEGLKKLEYRGYDSAGIAFLDQSLRSINIVKSVGKLDNLEREMVSLNKNYYCGIGHTRWATHGEANYLNSHPHTDLNKKIALVHNGIIENHFELKDFLNAQQITFVSNTDTEVIPHLFSLESEIVDLKQQVVNVVNKLQGSFAFLALINDQDTLIAARQGSPLCIGVGNNENFIASDCIAFSKYTNKVIYLPEKSFALVNKDSVKIFDFAGNLLDYEIKEIDIDNSTFDLTGYAHFMLKEIHEQPIAIKSCIDGLINEQALLKQILTNTDLIKLKSIHLIGCGSSCHAARIAQFYFEHIAKIPTQVHLASEFRYMEFFPEKDSLYIALSQSGETADTLEAVRMIKRYNLNTLAITNVFSSSLARECSNYLLTRAGPEISVAATKSFSTQVSLLYYLANFIALHKGLLHRANFQESVTNLYKIANLLEKSLQENVANIKDSANIYSNYDKLIILGRHITYPFAMEAALKLKEISYIFTDAYAAGELKHGSIALVDKNTPVMIFSSPDTHIYQKILSNAQEVKARKGKIISFVFEGQDELMQLSDTIIKFEQCDPLLGPILMTGLMQNFFYNIALNRGCEIDKPRNLAKSVTVE